MKKYLYKVYCETEAAWVESQGQDGEILNQCPNDINHTTKDGSLAIVTEVEPTKLSKVTSPSESATTEIVSHLVKAEIQNHEVFEGEYIVEAYFEYRGEFPEIMLEIDGAVVATIDDTTRGWRSQFVKKIIEFTQDKTTFVRLLHKSTRENKPCEIRGVVLSIERIE